MSDLREQIARAKEKDAIQVGGGSGQLAEGGKCGGIWFVNFGTVFASVGFGAG